MPDTLNQKINDEKERTEALDPTKSFIVQAPAGSGKTSILVQRYLVLLAKAKSPEEILAITFTRKAALEMQDRVIDALEKATVESDKETTNDTFQTKTKSLAKEVIKQDLKWGWNLLKNPHHLKIQTIDSLCHSIASKTPLKTSINSETKIITDLEAHDLYQSASQNLIRNILRNSKNHYYQFIETLLFYLDNDLTKTINLCIAMLKTREQWLPYIVKAKGDRSLRDNMEAGLKNIIQENIASCENAISNALLAELEKILVFANQNLKRPPPSSPFQKWLQIAELLLTKEKTIRQSFTVNQGFPATNSSKNKEEQNYLRVQKEAIKSLVVKLSEDENFIASLVAIANSPPENYTEKQWQIILTLLELLPLLAAELKVQFKEKNVSDHIEISMAANGILGNPDAPHDLLLIFDAKLKHLLIDEFQDTSIAQYRLIEKLTASWEEGCGRTIFLVGDPMQSIYRFRQAEVGLFLRAKKNGIGLIKFTPLTLTTNFRSENGIISWVNEKFKTIMPPYANIGNGAIPYSHSFAAKEDAGKNTAITIKIITDASYEDEAREVIATIRKIESFLPAKNVSSSSKETIAILVKSRSHLREIIKFLRVANIKYQAIELETLDKSSVISDLFSLTKALISEADRVAWLAILRAPWCGLTLNDLHVIANGPQDTIFANISAHENLPLSLDARVRLKVFAPIIINKMQNRYRGKFSDFIKSAWLELGGKMCLDANNYDHPEIYFAILDRHCNPNLKLLKKEIANIFASSSAEEKSSLQIMTIHKAKGLEFDHVIIPGINRAKRSDEKKLLLWQERPRLNSDASDLILAPINATNEIQDNLYEYLKRCEYVKEHYENGRLFYVAATRAKKKLYLFGTAEKNKDEKNFPQNSPLEIEKNNASETQEKQKASENKESDGCEKNIKIQTESFLSLFNPSIDSSWLIKPISDKPPEQKENSPLLKRLKSNIFLKRCSFLKNTEKNRAATLSKAPTFQDQKPQIIGTIIHRALYNLSQKPLPEDGNYYVKSQRSIWINNLKSSYFPIKDLASAIDIIEISITKTLQDPKGSWILNYNHKLAKSEYALTMQKGSEAKVNIVIDRTFIDDDDTRWIIDYKTIFKSVINPRNNHRIDMTEENIKDFFKPQLEQYAKAFSLLEARPIRLGLYFPLQSQWLEL